MLGCVTWVFGSRLEGLGAVYGLGVTGFKGFSWNPGSACGLLFASFGAKTFA